MRLWGCDRNYHLRLGDKFNLGVQQLLKVELFILKDSSYGNFPYAMTQVILCLATVKVKNWECVDISWIGLLSSMYWGSLGTHILVTLKITFNISKIFWSPLEVYHRSLEFAYPETLGRTTWIHFSKPLRYQIPSEHKSKVGFNRIYSTFKIPQRL